jgi:hypothetical protein
MRGIGYALVGAALLAAPASAGSLPSSKVSFAQGDLYALGNHACASSGFVNGGDGACLNDDNNDEGGNLATDDTGWNTILRSYMKTPNNKEVGMAVYLQCGLVTFTEAKAKGSGKTGGSGSAASGGRIVVRVGVTPVDNDGNEIGDTEWAYPENDGANPLAFNDPDNPAGEADGVTFCSRFQELSLSFANLQCLSDDSGIPAEDCEIAVSLLLSSLSAHSYYFIYPNAESGNMKIEVEARALADADVFGGDGSARGEAFVGLGTMHAETVRAIKSFNEDTGAMVTFEELQ